MTWDRIEEEWTTMTRRIRADWRDGPAGLKAPRREREAAPPWPAPPADSGLGENGSENSSLPTLR
ncbi:hypothetical protein [Rhodovulum strictum]|uniref:hypothetical protein n=1 Tax=Rhodovulum strictum TaxID=58314 RepID=UPI0014784330|nr:hypothetical protein [Rhodovulum strictum]